MNSEFPEPPSRSVPDIILRLYRPEDEGRVRHICLSTALYGRSIEPLVHDPYLVANALLLYHIRYEPEALYVATANGTVIGYLAGCIDRRRLMRVYLRRILPAVALRFMVRGHFLRPAAWRLLFSGARHGRIWRRYEALLDREYPALLHINLAEGFRGVKVGSQLLARFMDHLRSRDIRGVHISTASQGGMTFFSRSGFEVLATGADVSVDDGSPVKMWLMGRKVAAAPEEGLGQ
jgi:ribosomal protein S18 acetylase RimI-like enzyme